MVKKIIIISCLASSLSACISLQQPKSEAHEYAAGYYHFEWQLSGHRAVAPLQVFDDGKKTWLQFAPGQPVPAIFAITSAGDHLLTPQAQGEYQVLDGVWPQLRVRGGRQQSLLHRLDPLAPLIQEEQVQALTIEAPTTSAQTISIVAQTSTAIQPQLQLQEEHSLVPLFEAGPGDVTLRGALLRWADSAGWTFLPEHWAVDVDIPLVGSAVFQQPFEAAVQELVASTELGDYPLQPCFYSNKVLRVVRYATPCNRMAGGQAS